MSKPVLFSFGLIAIFASPAAAGPNDPDDLEPPPLSVRRLEAQMFGAADQADRPRSLGEQDAARIHRAAEQVPGGLGEALADVGTLIAVAGNSDAVHIVRRLLETDPQAFSALAFSELSGGGGMLENVFGFVYRNDFGRFAQALRENTWMADLERAAVASPFLRGTLELLQSRSDRRTDPQLFARVTMAIANQARLDRATPAAAEPGKSSTASVFEQTRPAMASRFPRLARLRSAISTRLGRLTGRGRR
jgi:hypothetical protein